MNHYFTNNEHQKYSLSYIDYCFKEEKFRFATTSGIFSKAHVDYATDILLNAIPPLAENGTLLDMGCGYGPIGIVLAKCFGLKLTQADVNKAAADLARLNCKYNGVKSDVIVSDCFDGIKGKFDTIVINPPIHAGKSVTYKMYEDSLCYLNSGGCLYVVTLKKHGAESTLQKLREVFDNRVEIIYKKKGIYVFVSRL
ncbi:MAG: methyltransferase [Oscillospiraceae bacterium]|nr:methyltransferase [Oscillospiraceae bacterium]